MPKRIDLILTANLFVDQLIRGEMEEMSWYRRGPPRRRIRLFVALVESNHVPRSYQDRALTR